MASYLTIGITQNSQSIPNNTSNVTVTVSIYSEASWTEYQKPGYCTIDGTRYDFTSSFKKGTTTKIFEKTVNVSHNNDGTKTLSVYASFSTNLSIGTLTKSASKVLTTIPRATQPTLSSSSVNLGSEVTITMNRASSAFTHTLTYSFGSVTGTIGSSLGTSKTWTPALDLASQIPNATSGTVVITCKTYNGSTLIGTKTVNLTINVPSTVTPTISGIAISDTVSIDSQTLVEKYGAYIQNKSIPKATINASASYSTIKQYKVSYQGTSLLSNTNEVTLGLLTQTGSVTIAVEVMDGRGRTASSEITITSLAYNSPSVSATVIRCNQDGTANDDGAYMKVTCKTTITALNDINSKSVVLTYKRKSETSWTTAKTWTAYSIDEAVIISADADSSYDIKLTATDDFSGSDPATFTTEIGTTEAIMDFKSDGKGMAIGKASERYGLEVEWNAQFNNDVNINEVNFKPSDSFKEHWAAILNGETPSGTNPLLDLIHPVGSIYWSTNITSPETLFGGTWEQIKDTFILAAGDSYSAGSTGGEAEHKLKPSEIPAHTHGSKSLVGYFNIRGCNTGGKTDTITYADGIMSKTYSTWSGSHERLSTTANTNPNIYRITTDASHEHNSVGGSGAHNNMPPYLVAYCWKRTA